MKKSIVFIFALICCIFIAGCGEDTELKEYYSNMNSFYTNVNDITSKIDAIDENSENAEAEVREYLAQLLVQFEMLDKMSVPKNFYACESLADEAYSSMNECVRLYTAYYDNGNYEDTATISMAEGNYNKAMERIKYISIILQGEIPTGKGINVTEVEMTDFTPVDDEDDEIYEESFDNNDEMNDGDEN